MMGKAKFLVGMGIGYVLGTRSGSERYQQMKGKAQEMWRNPRVQEQAGHAQTVLKEKAGDVGSTVASKVSSKTGGSGSSSNSSNSSSPSSPGSSSTATSTPGTSSTGTSTGSSTPPAPGTNKPSAFGDQPPGTLS